MVSFTIGGILSLFLASPAYAFTLKGGVQGSYFSANDEVAGGQNFQIGRLNLRLNASGLGGNENLTMDFRGSRRIVSGDDYNENIPEQRIETAKVQWHKALRYFDISLGRDRINNIGSAKVDGTHVKFAVSKIWGLGAFTGTAPDPYSDEFSSKHTTFGGYGFLRTMSAGITAGYVDVKGDGAEETKYIAGTGYLFPSRELSIFGSIRADYSKETKQYSTTNIFLSAAFRMGHNARFGLNLNQYKGIKLYDSMDYDINYELQRSARIYYVFAPLKRTKITGRVEGRTRASDGESVSLYGIGIKQEEIFKWFFVEARYRNIQYFDSSVVNTNFSIGAEKGSNMEAQIGIAINKNSNDYSENDMNQLVYSASFDWLATDKTTVGVRYEVSSEKFLNTDAVYTASAEEEYRSSYFHMYAGLTF